MAELALALTKATFSAHPQRAQQTILDLGEGVSLANGCQVTTLTCVVHAPAYTISHFVTFNCNTCNNTTIPATLTQ